MPVEVFVTLDLFLRDWHTGPGGELWLCAQPHVLGVDKLGEWVDSLGAAEPSREHQYRLLSLDADPAADFFPVNFAHDVDLTLELLDGAGSMVMPALVNERRVAVSINNTEADRVAFRRANVEDNAAAHDGQGLIKEILPGPFARGYNLSLLDARRGRDRDRPAASTDPVAIERLGEMLTLGFWGGKIKRLPRGVATNLDRVTLMDLRDGDPNILATNLHSLNGLMFRLGTRGSLDTLKLIRRIRLGGRTAGASFNIESADGDALNRSFAAFFEKLPDATPGIKPPEELVTSRPHGVFNRRVYVLESLVPFNHQVVNGEQWFRRRAEDSSVAESLKVSDMRRIVARLRKKDDGAEPTLDEYRGAAQLEWRIYETYDARLVPYRNSTALHGGAQGFNIPLHLMPNDRSRSAFYDEIRQACDRGENPLQRMEIYDRTGAKISPQPIGCYEFVWDQKPPDSDTPDESIRTVLFFGVPPSSPEVTVRFERSLRGASPPQTFRLELKENDLWGLRLEFEPPSNPPPADVSFDTLVCSRPPGAPPDPPLDDLARLLAPGVAFKSDLQFQFAQSASSMEAVLVVDYPHAPDPDDPTDVDPQQEYEADIVNHNALHGVAVWERRAGGPPRREEVNPTGQIFPVGLQRSPHISHFFKVDHRFPTDPKPPRPSEPAPNVRAFFDELYRDMGTQRRYEFTLEHTYGTSFPIRDVGVLSSHADFPVALPTDVRAVAPVRLPGVETPPSPCDSETATPFLTIDYDPRPCTGSPAGTECGTLIFDLRLLDPALYNSDRCRGSHVGAWRAVAELARAERILLRGRFYFFDFRSGLAQERLGRIADALKLIEGSDEWFTDVSSAVRERCLRWLTTGVIEEPTIRVALQPFNGRRIGEVCNVCEFQLDVRRSAQIQPPGGDWHLRRALPLTDEQEGQRTEPYQIQAQPLFDEFLRTLRALRAPIEPAKDDRERAEEFRRRIGEPSAEDFRRRDGETEAEEGAVKESQRGAVWIIPNELSPPAPPEQAVPSACPLGFLPLKKNSFLGDATTTMLRRYFAALKLVLEIGAPGGWTAWQHPQWLEFFNGLNAATSDAASPLRRMMEKVQDLVLPIPPPEFPAGGPAQNPEIRDVVLELRDRSGGTAHPLRGHIRSWLYHRLLSDPGVFSEAKALLYTRLRSDGGNQLLTNEFYEVISHKLIGTAEAEGGAEPQKITDRDRYTFRQTLTRLKDTPWFGVAEILDDLRYDSDFQFENFQLRRFEDVLRQVSDPNEEQSSTIRIKDNVLHLPCNHEAPTRAGADAPCGTQLVNVRPELERPIAERPLVRLTSRETLSNPVHVFTGFVNRFQLASGIDGLAPGHRFSLRRVQRGDFGDDLDAGEPAVRLRLKSKAFDRNLSRRLDDYVLTSVFTIKGDEESVGKPDSPQNIFNAFRNDKFFANHLGPGAAVVPAVSGVPSPPPAVIGLFQALAENPRLAQLASPQSLLHPDVLMFVREALAGIDPPDTAVPRDNGFAVRSDCPGFCIKFANPQPVAEAMLFGIDQDPTTPAATLPRGYLLIVNLLVPVWQPASIGLVHERNVSADFAPEFGQVSTVISDAAPFQPVIELDLSRVEENLLTNEQRRISVADLVTIALKLDGPVRRADPDAWRNFDLTVKSIHRQRTQVRTLTFNGNSPVKSLGPLTNPSAFPLLQRFIAAGRPESVNQQNLADLWFPPEFDEFFLELQWSSPSNLQFFSLRSLFRIRS